MAQRPSRMLALFTITLSALPATRGSTSKIRRASRTSAFVPTVRRLLGRSASHTCRSNARAVPLGIAWSGRSASRISAHVQTDSPFQHRIASRTVLRIAHHVIQGTMPRHNSWHIPQDIHGAKKTRAHVRMGTPKEEQIAPGMALQVATTVTLAIASFTAWGAQ